jgi:hypothetical protein
VAGRRVILPAHLNGDLHHEDLARATDAQLEPVVVQVLLCVGAPAGQQHAVDNFIGLGVRAFA